MQTGRRQRGASMFSLMLIAAAAGLAILIGLRLFPIYADYWTVVSIAKSVAADAGEDRSSRTKVRERVRAHFQTNNVQRLKPDVIKIEYDKQRNLVLVVEYEDRRPVIANLDVVAKFNRKIGGGL